MNGRWRNWLGQAIIWVSLAAGTLAAATAYLAPLDRADEDLLGLTLTAKAGRQPNETTGAPLVDSGQKLSADQLAVLRAAGVRYVRVKEFSWGRWPGNWWFLLSLGGLIAGAVLIRTAEKGQAAAESGMGQLTSPEQILDTLQISARELQAKLNKKPTPAERMTAITTTVGEWQRNHFVRFVEARPALVARLGLGGYAELMSSFAAAERQFNRAWCAAADEHEPEALASLQAATEILQETRDRLKRGPVTA